MNQHSATNAPEAFQIEVERVRAGAALGRGTQPARLFEFLVACHAVGRVPKEVEVAVDCFDRRPDADLAQDTTVRVTAHKLRRRLEEFYREAGGNGPRLSIPRGEYRLALEAQPVPAEAPAAPAPAGGWRRLLPARARERVAALLLAMALLAGGVAAGYALRGHPPTTAAAALRNSPLWAPIFADGLPVQLVLGDYFIFGERDRQGVIRRLVRDFEINSREELKVRAAGEGGEAYADLNLGYLPTSSAQALREVLPVVMASGKPVMLTLASELDPATLKSTHIVYLGYLSALGMLQELVFDASGYSLGGSFDELVDSVTGTAWVSEAGEPHGTNERYRDYAYLTRLTGPGGVAHLVLAGTRDVGLMQAAEAAADPAQQREFAARVPGRGPFEALYEVQGLNGVNVQARLIEARGTGP